MATPPFGERLAADAALWQAGQRAPWGGFGAATAWLWLARGDRRASIDPVVRAFVEASFAALGDRGYSRLLHERDYCSRCGARYRLENLAWCVECSSLYCPSCSPSRCACGGDIVG